MKKLFLKILLVYSIGWFAILPVYARAGGGNGGDSGSSSGNGYSYYEYHDYSNGSSSSHIDSIILVGVGGFLLFGGIMNAFNKNKQNVVKSHMWEKAQQVDPFWDEHILSDKISKSYFTIQQAWSDQNIQLLKLYLTPSLWKEWELKIQNQIDKGERNLLTDVALLDFSITDILLEEESFYVYIKGKMNDRTIDKNNQVIEFHDQEFIEYWKFKRVDENILLDEIRQKDEYIAL
ncbi:TIM44-like domain-containing protein [Longibaculum muris]|uniref:TIM44-like domain-containing protein n=1 Tax=Longibaculum muris TaxID=1796628 RepID=UPI0022E4B3A6|nr:TIM44-like domain-containing protein [Longibaculum muris]